MKCFCTGGEDRAGGEGEDFDGGEAGGGAGDD